MYAYTRIEYEYVMMNEMIESEMHKVRNNALQRLSSLFVHLPTKLSIKELALTLAYGYFDSYKPSENLSNNLDLSKLDFLAIQEEFDGFKEEYLKDRELYQDFYGEI